MQGNLIITYKLYLFILPISIVVKGVPRRKAQAFSYKAHYIYIYIKLFSIYVSKYNKRHNCFIYSNK